MGLRNREFSPEFRVALAEYLRKARRVEREVISFSPDWREKRDRSAAMYYGHLQGLDATLWYAQEFSGRKKVVDLGAGTSRAIAEIAAQNADAGFEFLATGLINEPEAAQNLGRERYRVTPAELMRGFEPSSVGCFLSVYGPFEHSWYLDLVFRKIDELLVPGGIIKLCVIRNVPGATPEMNQVHQITCDNIEACFMAKQYGFASRDLTIAKKIATSRIFLAVKPGVLAYGLNDLALEIMKQDLAAL